MSRLLLSLCLLGAMACNGSTTDDDKDAETDDTLVDTDAPVDDTDEGPSAADACSVEFNTDLMREQKIPEVRDNLLACASQRAAASDAWLAFGLALTKLLTVDTWDAVIEAAEACDQPDDAGERLWGPDGIIAELAHATDVTSDLGVSEASGNGPSLGSEFGLINTWGSSGERTTRFYLGGDRTFAYNYAYIRFENGAPPVGTPIDLVANADIETRLRVDCDDRSDWRCDSHTAVQSGTITVTAWGTQPGDRLAFDLDVTLIHDDDVSTEWDDSLGDWVEVCDGLCRTLRLSGSVDDTIEADAEDLFDGLTFTDWYDPCDTDDCLGERFPHQVAANCNITDFAQVHLMADQLQNRFGEIAALFRAAGEDPSLSFIMPQEAVPWVTGDLHYNQGDALALAAALESMAFGGRMAWAYRVLDPSSSPDDLTTRWTSEVCRYNQGADQDELRTVNGPGTTVRDLYDQLEAHGGSLRPGVDLSVARQRLRQLALDLVAALGTSPTGVGMFTPQRADNSYRNDIIAELQALLASLDTSDPVPLPSEPNTLLTVGAFFDAPPTQISVEAGLGEQLFEFQDDEHNRTCYTAQGEVDYIRNSDYIDGQVLGRWVAMGAGAIALPGVTDTDGYFYPYYDAPRDRDLPYPGYIDDFELVWPENTGPDFLDEDQRAAYNWRD